MSSRRRRAPSNAAWVSPYPSAGTPGWLPPWRRPAAAMKELSRATEMAEELGVKPSAALEDLKLSLLDTT